MRQPDGGARSACRRERSGGGTEGGSPSPEEGDPFADPFAMVSGLGIRRRLAPMGMDPAAGVRQGGGAQKISA